mmetsp:Transcript_43127/g.68188  ORF Transcript_43127/g.68188 Transcript_43127/m.68188 type:complete len:172 (+) Transcript_43127:52-567(+)
MLGNYESESEDEALVAADNANDTDEEEHDEKADNEPDDEESDDDENGQSLKTGALPSADQTFAIAERSGSSVFNKTYVEESKERHLQRLARDQKKSAANAPVSRPKAVGPQPVAPEDEALDAVARMGGAGRAGKRAFSQVEQEAELRRELAEEAAMELRQEKMNMMSMIGR